MTELKSSTPLSAHRKAPVRKKSLTSDLPAVAVRSVKKTVTDHPHPKPVKVVSHTAPHEQYWSAVGRRKQSTAKIKLRLGGGTRTVNGKEWRFYFPSEKFQNTILAPLVAVGMGESASFVVTTRGGGIGGQATATQLAVARALVAYDLNFKKTLRAHGFMTRDPRVKERKKYGLKRARRAPQWSKR